MSGLPGLASPMTIPPTASRSRARAWGPARFLWRYVLRRYDL